MTDFKPLFEQIKQSIVGLLEIPESGSMKFGTFRVKCDIESAEKCLEYDPQGFTSISHLELKWIETTKEIQFPLDDILNNTEEFLRYQKFGHVIKRLFEDEEFTYEKEHFIKVVRDGIKHYGADADVAMDEIIEARYNSLNSYKTLENHQFLKGAFNPAPPTYIKQIYEWWNINSLLRFAVTLPNSVSMHLIRNPNLFEIYFCFVIKNGSNVYIMTDKAQHENPLYYQMSRRPDRDLARKIGGHSFPYYLMNVDAEHGELYYTEKEDLGNALTPYQKETKIISTVDQLEKSCLTWTILMFNLIEQNYFLNHVELPDISYTADMIREPAVLIDHAKKHGLVLHQDVKHFERNTKHSISTQNVDHSALGSEVSTNWMEQRYGHLVNDEILNLIAKVEDEFELDTRSNTVVENPKGLFLHHDCVKLNKSSTSDFGTAEQLQRDHIFRARDNYVKTIKFLAKQEFDREEKAMDAWFHELVNSNVELVMRACKAVKHGYTLTKDSTGNWNYERNGNPILFDNTDISMFSKLGERSRISQYHLRYWPKHHIGKRASRNSDHECCISGKKAAFGFGFMFYNIEQLVEFFGISVFDVPEFMRFYSLHENSSRGNQILNRIDPMANIKNPFSNYKLSILVLFSKSELKKFGKES